MAGGWSFDADLCVAWPTAEICVMSVEGAVDVAYRQDVESAPRPAAHRAGLIDGFRRRLGALPAAAGFGLDDVIDPRDRLGGGGERTGRTHRPGVLSKGLDRGLGPSAIRGSLGLAREDGHVRLRRGVDASAVDVEHGGDAARWAWPSEP